MPQTRTSGKKRVNNVVGFIGLGSMGLPIAMNLVESGYKLRVHNQTVQKAQPLVDKGADLDNRLALGISEEAGLKGNPK